MDECQERMKMIQQNINRLGMNILDFDEALVSGLIDKVVAKEDNKIMLHFKAGMIREVQV